MSSVLVTGAQGFTAAYLLPRLLERGFDVHGLNRPGVANASSTPGVIPFEADLSDLAAVTRWIRSVRPNFVVHLAGISFVAHGDTREIYESNLIGSRNLLQALVDAEVRPDAVLMASSANVYGNQRGGILAEDGPLQPVNDYGISKVAMESVARLFMDRLPIIIVRPFNYTGVGQSTDFVIPRIIDHARRKVAYVELGNLDVERDFSDVRSIVDYYLRLLDTPRAVGQTFNVCSGRGYALREVIGLVEQLSGHSMEVRSNSALVRQNEVKTLYGDNSRLIDMIGPLGFPPLESTLRWMLEA